MPKTIPATAARTVNSTTDSLLARGGCMLILLGQERPGEGSTPSRAAIRTAGAAVSIAGTLVFATRTAAPVAETAAPEAEAAVRVMKTAVSIAETPAPEAGAGVFVTGT